MRYYHAMTRDELISALKVAESELGRLNHLHQPRHDVSACQRCGRRDSIDAVVENKIWNTIMGKPNLKSIEGVGGILCLWCMDALALEKDVGGKVQLHYPGWALISDSYKKDLNKNGGNNG